MTHTLRFERDLTKDEQELVSLLGWRAGLALGVPVTLDRRSGDGRLTETRGTEKKPRRVEPWQHGAADGIEARVACELDHLMRYAGTEVQALVQVEIGMKAWQEVLRGTERFILTAQPESLWMGARRVSFRERWGWLQGPRVMGIPIVVLLEGGPGVLRPRWPGVQDLETGRL